MLSSITWGTWDQLHWRGEYIKYSENTLYVTPEDVQAVFVAITAHRLTAPAHQSTHSMQMSAFDGEKLSQKLLDSVDPLAA